MKVSQEFQREKNHLEKIQSEIDDLPEGGLSNQKTPYSEYYYHTFTVDSKRRRERILDYTDDGKILIAKLTRKKQLIKTAHTLQDNIKAIESFLRKTTLFDPIFDDIINNSDSAKWSEEPYLTNPGYPENLKYPASDGKLLRSKSEVFIYDTLLENHIEFRYESMLRLKDGSVIYPDFTMIRKSDNCIVLWEHLGKLDDPDYVYNSLHRLIQLHNNGFILGENLFITYESSVHPFTSAIAIKTLRSILEKGDINRQSCLEMVTKLHR